MTEVPSIHCSQPATQPSLAGGRSAAVSYQRVWQKIYAPVAAELAEVESFLESQLQSQDAFVDEIARHGYLLGGKRLRPALILLAGKAVGALSSAHRITAAALEMIHTATLVHDDVLDEADDRRHNPTINSRWNNNVSILFGDFLFSQSFYLVATTGDANVCRRIGEATNRVCAGELLQVGQRGNLDLSEKQYFDLVGGKTAELIAVSCELGGYLSGASEAMQKSLKQFGYSLGIAFQIVDDLLDYVGETERIGKPVGSDIGLGEATLPLIHLLRTAPDDVCKRVRSHASGHEDLNGQLVGWLSEFGSLDFAIEAARRCVAEAKQALQELPESAAKSSLVQLADAVTARNC